VAQPGQERRGLVAPVPSVRLVGPLAREHHLHVAGGEPRELEQRRRRRDPARLLEPRHAARQFGEEVGLRHRGLVVVGADQAGALGRQSALVQHLVVTGEADRECGRRGVGAPGHRRHHRGGVHPSGQEGAVGDVGHHLALDCRAEALGQPGRELVVAGVERGAGRLAEAGHDRRAALLDRQDGRGRQLLHTLEQRSGSRYEPAREEVVERHPVHLRLDEPGRDQGPDLGRQRHASPVAPPVERLDPELVAGRHEPPPVRVPEREGEDPVQLADEVRPVLLVGVHHDLAVRPGSESVPLRLEPRPQLAVVVDLAVDDRRDSAVLRVERLVAAGHVDDRQTRVRERERADAPHRLPVGPPMAERLHHSVDRMLAGATRRRIEDRADPAHAGG
jgi:hypothetical protein